MWGTTTLWPDVLSIDFDILFRDMPSDGPTSQPSEKDRRAYFRVNVVLPISIQAETDTTEGELRERSVNISGGGIGVTVNVLYNPNEVLSLTLLLPDQVIFKAYAEILRLDPIPYPIGTYRLHARFVRMNTKNRELLIRYIMRFQRDHLRGHYSA
jgi:c-di-GMP-binding flagellar brake protein YcgR